MKIVVLGGGISTERNVSIVTGMSVCRTLRARGHQAIFVDMFLGLENYDGTLDDVFDVPDGFCREVTVSQQEPELKQVIASRKKQGQSHLGDRVLDVCARADIVFLGLHGIDGEDGKIQAALELLGIPYTGSGHLGSAMAMDKAVTKRIMESTGILTPKWQELNYIAADIPELTEELTTPCVVKTVSGGSSIGVIIADNKTELEAALHEALNYGKRVIIEEKITGRELTVPILNDRCLEPVEILPPEDKTFDYVAKYQSGSIGATEICPAGITEAEKKSMGDAALLLHRVLGLRVYSRVDFILDEYGRAWCLEINTLPGLTPNSLLPKAAKVEGLDYGALCETIVKSSLEK